MIRHGLVQVENDMVMKEKLDAYIALLNMPENTVSQIFDKYSALACECPDNFMFWNILKLFVLKHEGKLNAVRDEKYKRYARVLEEEDGDFLKYVQKQDRLTFLGIQNNCKSYAVWNHRKYIYKYVDQVQDFKLCNLLFKLDPRNFHCWNYVKYHGYKIEENLDNYSSLSYKMPGIAKMILIEPNNRSFWILLKMKLIGRSFVCIKVFEKCVRFNFKHVFKGNVVFGLESTAINEHTKSVDIDVGFLQALKILEQGFVINNKFYTFRKVEIPRVVNEILLLEKENKHALEFKEYFSGSFVVFVCNE